MLTGENGILTQAQNAKDKTEQAEKEEMSDLDSMESLINEYTGDVKIPQVTDENPGKLEQENANTFVINSIEDLVVFSHNVRSGDKYEGQTVKLGVNLDFKSDKSYVDPDRTDYGIYGYYGNLKQLLTTEEGFIPIGSQDETNCFYGTFDGNNNVICSLYENINTNENMRAGLFLTNYGEIKNLGLINVDISAIYTGGGIGGITARSYNSIRNCYVTGNIKAEGNSWMPVGGICGPFCGDNAVVENCYNLANINCRNTSEDASTADIVVGGIIAQIEGTNINIEDCYNEGKITVNSKNASMTGGGIVAHVQNEIEINKCFNRGEVSINSEKAPIKIGGICGHHYGNGTIENSYNVGGVNATCGNIGATSVNVAGIVRCFRF